MNESYAYFEKIVFNLSFYLLTDLKTNIHVRTDWSTGNQFRVMGTPLFYMPGVLKVHLGTCSGSIILRMGKTTKRPKFLDSFQSEFGFGFLVV